MDARILFRKRSGEQKRRHILRRFPVHHRLPAGHRPLNGKRTFSSPGRGLHIQTVQCGKQMPHRTRTQRRIAVKRHGKWGKRRKTRKNFHRRSRIRHIHNRSRITQFSSGSSHAPAGIIPSLDRRPEQRRRAHRRQRILRHQRCMNTGNPLRHHGQGYRSNCMGFGTGNGYLSGKTVLSDNQIHFLKILPSIFTRF